MALGHFDPFKMLDESPPWLLDWWMGFAEIEPIGEQRADMRNALLGTAVCSSLGARVEPKSFLPFSQIDTAIVVQDVETQKRIVGIRVAAHNASMR